MKILMKWLVLIVILLTLTGCDLLESIFGPEKTTLRVINNSSFDLDIITWYDYDNTEYKIGDDSVWDSTISSYLKGLNSGSSDIIDVSPGDSPIYFYFSNSYKHYSTQESVKVSAGRQTTFTFSDSTYVIELSY